MLKRTIIFTFLFIILILYNEACAQVVYNHKIDSIKNLVSIQQLIKFNKEITGDTITSINGVPKRIVTRYAYRPVNKLAAQYIAERFRSYGLDTNYQMYDTSIKNVVGWKTGTKYPNQYFLIGAHFDNIVYGSTLDTIYGADDNGTGICVLLELARLIQGFNTDYSIAFVAFNEEETSMGGSSWYAGHAFNQGDSLLGVLNCEMLGYDGNGDNKVTVVSRAHSDVLCNTFISAISGYQLNLVPMRSEGASADHLSFWLWGYKAITTSEWIMELTPHYHGITDRWFNLTFPMFEKMAKADIVTFLSLATGNYCEIIHTPVSSTFEQTDRVVSADIRVPSLSAYGSNSPRLYFKINNGQYNWVSAYEVNGKIYRFLVPGQLPGTKISYYIAAQDSAGSVTATSPFGGSGVNPPGTIHPDSAHVYYVLKSNTFISNTVPKVIPAGSTVRDTIHVSQAGNIKDVRVNININHPNNAEVMINLLKVAYYPIPVTFFVWNGCSGSNFINTNFTDTAALSIYQGTAPYTGYFRGSDSLSRFKNLSMQGDWILIVHDLDASVTGTFNGWGITFAYENTVSVTKESETVPSEYCLLQNFPNPFNPVTNIKFSIPESGYTKIEIFNMLGQRIEILVDEYLNKGNYKTTFNGNGYPSGVYFCKITSGNFRQTSKMLLLK